MNYLYQLLSGLTSDPGQIRLLFMGIVIAGSFLLILTVLLLASAVIDPLRRRIQQLGQQPVAQAPTRSWDGFSKALAPLTSLIVPKKEWERSKASAQLIHAGFRAPNALMLFYSIKSACVIAFAALAFVLTALYPGFPSERIFLAVVIAAATGLLLPEFILGRLAKKREKTLRHGFPDALDLLVVCTEAGLGLPAALQRVAEEIMASHPELAGELALVNAEIRAGVDRTVALQNLSKRTHLKDIRGLVVALSQSMRLGASIADTLRVYADELRDKRMQKAEEEAAKVGTQMIFPLILCLFPSFFVVVVGPAVLGVLKTFGK
ncbi:MAG: tight adherence protein [Pseudomonadota bacterium]|nr:tight adherence protein [Pseudomonadota bacterium]